MLTVENNTIVKKQCLSCEKEKNIKKDFYISDSKNHKDGKFPICKACIQKSLRIDKENPLLKESIESVKDILLEMNRPFIYNTYVSSIEESKRVNRELFGIYLKNIFQNNRDLNWKDSAFEWENNDSSDINSPTIVKTEIINKQHAVIDKEDTIILDNRDKNDVIRMLGYDPFEHESELDRKYLYSRLLDFLSEDTLEDGFKLQAVIEIVTGFNQIDKINQAITFITNDINKLSDKSGGIQSLITAKKNILTSLLGLAKDNGISVNNNNNKSKGGNTLNGIVKKLNEVGLDEAELNLYDLETCESMKQIADFSNRSILEQLMLDENDYTGMISQQNEMIRSLDSKLIKAEEENRLLKVEINKLNMKINGIL